MSLLARIMAPFKSRSDLEGLYRPGPYFTMAGMLPADAAWNYWQMGIDPVPYGTGSAIVEACVSSYAQTIAMCPGDHWRTQANGGRERVTTSALVRILRKPNDYQSISDFLMNAVRQLYLTGNAYALALRNDRSEIAELHLMTSGECSAKIAADGSIFYGLAGNPIIDARVSPNGLTVPSRDVLHLRLQTPRHPLVGESPILSAALDAGLGAAMRAQQMRLAANSGRPSAVLSTDAPLSKEQADMLRAAWDNQARGLNAGGVPILTNGLKVQPWSTSSVDAQLVETMKMSDEAIAAAFRVPLAILGQGGGTAYASTELLMRQWIASGLGFALNHIEESVGNLFGLKGQPDEYLEFGTDALLRSAFKDRIDGLARAVQGGILAPNEARNLEGYRSVEFGDEPRVQQQVVPLSAAGSIPAAPGPEAPPPAAAQDVQNEEPADDGEDAAKDFLTAYAEMSVEHDRQAA